MQMVIVKARTPKNFFLKFDLGRFALLLAVFNSSIVFQNFARLKKNRDREQVLCLEKNVVTMPQNADSDIYTSADEDNINEIFIST